MVHLSVKPQADSNADTEALTQEVKFRRVGESVEIVMNDKNLTGVKCRLLRFSPEDWEEIIRFTNRK